ncbi:hypothetical protein QFC22_002564 [Naganishia vaughanmartiniae]|uniref:Uncharacterized protein n=1 Tax=Naganishia vaughanmartiniae TaxID=1424756 RepID=A0ACC2XAN7_9TREE|nr:hypothetical protein QFC22_002564 [Naganishia vaughanmartiniae]
MSSHRDFTPDQDEEEDELLLPTPRQPESSPPPPSRRQDRQRATATTSAVTSIRLKIGGKGSGRSSSSTTELTAPPPHEGADEDDDGDEQPSDHALRHERLPSPTIRDPSISFGKSKNKGLPRTTSSTADGLRPSSSTGGSRKRVLSNTTEPAPDETDIQRSDAVGTTATTGGGRKRAKLSTSGTGAGKKPLSNKRGSKLSLAADPQQAPPRTVDWGSLTPVDLSDPDVPPHHHHDAQGMEEDALLADEISLMAAAEQGVKKQRSIKGSSPVRSSVVAGEANVSHERGGMVASPTRNVGSSQADGYLPPLAALIASAEGDTHPSVRLQNQSSSSSFQKRRATPESSPEIELVSATYNQRPPPPPGGAPKDPSSTMIMLPKAAAPPRKKKAWLKSAKLIPIAPNLGSSSAAAAFGAANLIATRGDPLGLTPPPANFYTAATGPGLGLGPEKPSKASKKSRAAAAAAKAAATAAAAAQLMSSPNPEESMDGDAGMMYRGGGDGVGMNHRGVDDMALDMALLGEGEGEEMVVKPKKKKSKKLKLGEVGPGKHWRKGVFGPHVARFPGDLGGDMTSELGGGGESPNSIIATSSGHAGRLLLPKPARGSKRRKLLHAQRGGEDELVPYHNAAGTPDEYGDEFERAANASTRSSPEISMRNDPTIGLSRSGMPYPAAAATYKPKPLIEGVDGECIVPKHPAEVDKLGHPVYRNSILTRGISIIRIQDFSGAKAKERELMVPRSLKDNLGPRARQFDEGYRVITGVGGARLQLRSWIPRSSPSEFRIERDAKIEEIRLAEAAVSDIPANPSRPGLFSSLSQRNLSLDGMTPEAWLGGNQAQIHPGQQVRKYSAFIQAGTGDAGLTPPKIPAKKKKKKKVVKSAEELIPDMPSPQLASRIASAVPTPDVMLNDPMEGVLVGEDEQAIDQSPYVDDLIMDAV